jgi:PAS domain S-box-containing protein
MKKGKRKVQSEVPTAQSVSTGIEQVRELERKLSQTEEALRAVLAEEVDALLDPRNAEPILLPRAQQALLESEARYRRLVNRINAIVFELDSKGAIRFVNDAVLRTTGYLPEELLGRNWEEIFFPDELSRHAKEFLRQIQSGDVSNYQFILVAKDRTQVLLEVNTANSYRPDGSLEKVVGIGIDITERNRLEAELLSSLEALRVSEEEQRVQNEELSVAQARVAEERQRYQDLFEFAPDGYLVTDPNGLILSANLAAAEMIRVSRERLVGKPLVLYIEKEGRKSFYNLLEQLSRGQAVRDWEISVHPRGGDPFQVVLIVAADRDDRNRLVSLRWLLHDITERKQAEELLRQSEARFRTIFKESPLGIKLVALNGRILESNPALQEMLGYSADELGEMSFTDFTHPDDRNICEVRFSAMAAGEGDRYDIEKRYIRKDGGLVWVHLTNSLVRDENGEPRFAVGLVENISNRKQMEADLSEVQRRLIDAREIERLHLAQELHDGPLQDLYGVTYQVGGLREALQNGSSEAHIANIQDTLQQVIQILRATCGELRPPTLAPFGLEKAIRSHAETFQQLYPEIGLHLDLMPDRQSLPERVRLALFRIYQHILANVVRHSGADRVEIRFWHDAEQILLEIQDNGRGFVVPKRWINLARQGHLGLIGALERAEAIGGNLKVDSKPGEGTRVRVIVPQPNGMNG